MSQTILVNKTIFFLLLLVSNINWSFSQSYKNYLLIENVDDRCYVAEQLSEKYMTNNLDSLRILGENLLAFSNKSQSKEGINLAYFLLGHCFVSSAREKEGMELLSKARLYYLKEQDFNRLTEILNAIGIGYSSLGNYEEAYKWYEQSLKYGQLSTDETYTFLAQINLSQALLSLNDYENAKKEAEEFRDWVLKLGKLNNTANAFAVLGKIELAQENYKEASYYFEQGNKFAERANDKSGQGHANTNMAIVKYMEGDMEQSQELFKKALELRIDVQNVAGICDAYFNYGGIQFERGQFDDAIESYLKGLKFSKQNNRFTDAIGFIEALREVYTEIDSPQLKELDSEMKVLLKKKAAFEEKMKSFEIELAKELRESERIRNNGFDEDPNRWPFYVGAFVLFIGFLFLAMRRNLNR